MVSTQNLPRLLGPREHRFAFAFVSLVSVFCCLTAPCKTTLIPALGLYDVRGPTGGPAPPCTPPVKAPLGHCCSPPPPGLLHVVAGCPYPGSFVPHHYRAALSRPTGQGP